MRNRRSRRSRRARTTQIAWKPTALGMLGFACLGGAGVVAYQDMNTLKPDEIGCFATPRAPKQHITLIDVSEPWIDDVQSRDLVRAISQDFRNIGFNERFRVITTQESRIGSVPAPVFTRCGTAKNSTELEEIGAASATSAYLKKQAEKAEQDELLPVLESVFVPDPADGDGQRFESPLFEQVQAMSRMRGFQDAPVKRLSLVSDLMQNTHERQHCTRKGDLPSYAKFKSSGYFQRIRPASLGGTDVTVYMLIRPYGQEPYLFCREDELRAHWKSYFVDAGANSVEFVRIRPSGKR